MEPSNNNISQMYIAENLCTELVLLMKQSTQDLAENKVLILYLLNYIYLDC